MLLKRRMIGVFFLVSMFVCTACGSDETAGAQETRVIKESEYRSAADTEGAGNKTVSGDGEASGNGTVVLSTVSESTAGGQELETEEATAESSEEPVYRPLDAGALEAAVWYPYWDNETADEELSTIGEGCDKVCFFAAYYDKNNAPFIPDDISRAYSRLKEKGQLSRKKTYLTFVNDKLLDKGSSLKDTGLLYSLLGDEEKGRQHAKDCIRLTQSLGCDGIEIDYEAIKKDMELWKHFNSFAQIISEEAEAAGLPLRIVFEPSAPVSSYDWPSYPEYVMMCYNLYGFGTEPGPKADIDFIKEMADKMKLLSGEIDLAFANGGFDFASDGAVKQINLSSITQILDENKITPSRDSSSGDMYFTYTDEGGLGHEIWYADQETLKLWMETAQNCGIEKVSVWRLGGNL
ncbi:MAG: glycosyl hydrolase [Butyrivibrio sp.]|nr:glycosyl hydrolase [Butyrivibrio sp.]